MISAGEAARLTGTSKTTIARAVKAGRLKATRGFDGSYQISPTDLAKCFGANLTNHKRSDGIDARVTRLEFELFALRRLVSDLIRNDWP